MDNESTKIVYERICGLEPENGLKIAGYIMLNTNEQDMIRLAFSPDGLIQCAIDKAKSDLGIPDVRIPCPFVSSSSRLSLPQPCSDFALQNQLQALSANPVRPSRRSEFPVKVCHYFSKGFCKHGSTCRNFHEAVEKSGNKNEEPRVVGLGGRALVKLGLEIIELLKSRGGLPICRWLSMSGMGGFSSEMGMLERPVISANNARFTTQPNKACVLCIWRMV